MLHGKDRGTRVDLPPPAIVKVTSLPPQSPHTIHTLTAGTPLDWQASHQCAIAA